MVLSDRQIKEYVLQSGVYMSLGRSQKNIESEGIQTSIQCTLYPELIPARLILGGPIKTNAGAVAIKCWETV